MGGILIPRQLTKDQYIKLFSNPVSGIICEFGLARPDVMKDLSKIRYSKSMILRALDFWYNYNYQRYSQIRKIHHITFDPSTQIGRILDGIHINYQMIKKYPDSYLFSHRYIRPLHHSKYSNPLKIQYKLLQEKLRIKMIEFQEGSLQPYYIFSDYEKGGIEFTVFPNEHPYIPKQKLKHIGKTDKGNVYIIFDKMQKGIEKND